MHTLSAADFIHYSDAELDAFTLDKQAKSGNEQRPAQPTRVEDWESRVRRQNEIWKLVYGAEWGEVREFALTTLVQWHHGSPHQWPLNVIMDVWEELHWRFFEELKEVLRALKKEAKRETLSLQEIRFYALLPGPDGQAWLTLPSTFDVTNPEGWFKTELEPRIARKQDRTLWRLTWEGPRDAFHHENPAICPFHHENPCWEKAHPAQTYVHYRLNQASAPTTVFSPRTHQYSAKISRVFSAIPGVFSANSRKILGLFFSMFFTHKTVVNAPWASQHFENI